MLQSIVSAATRASVVAGTHGFGHRYIDPEQTLPSSWEDGYYSTGRQTLEGGRLEWCVCWFSERGRGMAIASRLPAAYHVEATRIRRI